MKISSRQFRFGAHTFSTTAYDAIDAPYILAAPQIYAIGHGSGAIRPIGVEHLVGEMGGIWAHPVKVADGFTVALLDQDGAPLPSANGTFIEGPAELRWEWDAGPLQATRRDRVFPNAPVYATLLSVTNSGPTTISGLLEVIAELTFLGCWFGGLASARGSYRMADALLLGSDAAQPAWGVAFGAAVPPDSFQLTPRAGGATATLRYAFQLAPGASRSWLLLLAVSHDGGEAHAAARWRELIDSAGQRFADDESTILAGRPSIDCADQELCRDLALAQANLHLLQADYPDTGPYFLAGLPEYPQLFGCDTTYSVPGAVAAGFAATARSALLTLAAYAERACGRIPHEVTTNGRVFNPGNIQETPQFAIAVWDYLRWTGDMELARRLFPICREGLLEYVPAIGGPDPRYPVGDGMVERLGMGSRKLDSACYVIAGLRALARLAAALGDPEAARYAAHADAVNADFERDWWMEDEGLYGDSMHSDGRLQLDRHWTAVLPVQLGLAAPERASRVLARLEAEFVNQWGLVHTVEVDERVWTLPTGLLALAAFQHGRPERGLELARMIALTAQHGTLGTFKELIPEGLCFVQLWSAGLYVQLIIEGLLGLAPDAPAHTLTVAPSMPAGYPPVSVRGLRVGAHTLDLNISPRALQLDHREGLQALTVIYAGTTVAVAPATRLHLNLERS
ncbi:MAG: hypothetical protein OHK0015_44270 [Chloroflexi bacterium OHK40]